jgi:hypothetical protein
MADARDLAGFCHAAGFWRPALVILRGKNALGDRKVKYFERTEDIARSQRIMKSRTRSKR